MFKRYLSAKILKLSEGFPAIFLTGPRQSGKTTLVRFLFPKHRYVSLENPDDQDLALSDPRGFLSRYPAPCILDEVQRAPELLSYLQGLMDESPQPGQWILTGSQQLLLMNQVSQTLAGRIAIVHLLPLSLGELYGQPFEDPTKALKTLHQDFKPKYSLFEILYKGFYPRVHDQNLDPRDWYGAYYQTYVERDVRDVLKIGDLSTFRKFVRLCAGRSGQILNYSSLAVDAGISPPTAQSWLSVLEASSLVAFLTPHYRNFNKRMIKSPKLYFLDTGLLCHLLEIRRPEDLDTHPLRGALFETFVVSGFYKLFFHAGETPPLYFWRDLTGHEIDLLIDLGKELLPVEIKASSTITANIFESMRWWFRLKGNRQKTGLLCYAGEEGFRREEFGVQPWWAF